MNEKYANLLFIDTETTGREEHDRIFQVAYDFNGEGRSALFKPPVPLCIEAMEATGYTNRDVANLDPFEGSDMQKRIAEILQNNDVIFVAHNAQFDIAMLNKEGIEVPKFIDTLKVAQYLDENAKLGAYRLQYLRYALDLRVENARAHDALGDVRVLKALFGRMFDKLSQEYSSREEVLQKMLGITESPVEIKRISFGKYAGSLLKDIAKDDPGYLEWLLKQKESNMDNSHDQIEDWIYTLRKLVGKRE